MIYVKFVHQDPTAFIKHHNLSLFIIYIQPPFPTIFIQLINTVLESLTTSDNNTKSSAYNRLLIDLVPILTGAQILSKTLVMSLINILNRLGLRLSPWKTPTFEEKELVR